MAFFGAGPEGDWYIGIEYKTVDDVVACIKSGRFTGTQLPGMLRTYDMSFLLIEGLALLDHNSGQMAKRVGKTSYPFGLPYRNFDNFLTSVSVHSALAGKPCVVKKSASMNETVHIIRDMFEYFQKPWDKHKSISRPDLTKMQTASYDLEVIKVTPTDPEYPKYVLRKAIFQIDRVGWDLSGKAADHFGTLENALAASRLDWEDVFGPVVADRVLFSKFKKEVDITKGQTGYYVRWGYLGEFRHYKYQLIVRGTKKLPALRAAYYLLFGYTDFYGEGYVDVAKDDWGFKMPLRFSTAFAFNSAQFENEDWFNICMKTPPNNLIS